MGKIERFEDLIAWQKARELTRAIYEVTRQGAFAKDFGLSGQIQRAAVSIMSNIAEGFERGGRGEFHQFLSTERLPAQRSAPNFMSRSMSDTWTKPLLTASCSKPKKWRVSLEA